MKKTILVSVAILIGFALQLSAQEKDTIRVKVGNKKILIIEDSSSDSDIDVLVDSLDAEYDFDFDNIKDEIEVSKEEFEGHWNGFEFGFNALLNSDNKMPATEDSYSIRNARSWTFGINLFQKDIPLIKENFGLVGGLGMQFRNYHFENNVTPYKNDEGTLAWQEIPTDEREFSTNRLLSTYLTGVLAFEFQAPVGSSDNEFFILAGAYGNYRMGTNLKQKWDENGDKQKEKTKDDFYLNDYEYGLTGRIGIGKLNFFANYSLSPLFNTDKAAEWNNVTVGLTIIGF